MDRPLALFSLLFLIAFVGPSIYDFMALVFGYYLITLQYVFQLLLLIPELIWNSLLATISWVVQLADIPLHLFDSSLSSPIAFDLNGSGHIDSLLPFAPNVPWGDQVCVVGDPDFWPMYQIGHSIQFSSNPWNYTLVGTTGFSNTTGGHSITIPGPGGGFGQPQPMGHSAFHVTNAKSPLWRWIPAL